jgi:hypothetical protein
MLDSRRDRRYRRWAHRSVGLRKVTFHDKPGTSSKAPGFPLPFNLVEVEFCETDLYEVRQKTTDTNTSTTSRSTSPDRELTEMPTSRLVKPGDVLKWSSLAAPVNV